MTPFLNLVRILYEMLTMEPSISLNHHYKIPLISDENGEGASDIMLNIHCEKYCYVQCWTKDHTESIHSDSKAPLQPNHTHHPSSPLRSSHRLLNLLNGLARIQPLWTSPRAIKNSMAPIQAHVVIQHGLPLRLPLISTIG